MCYAPVLIDYRKYANLGDTTWMLVPCRQCLECRQTRANEWAMRCYFELKNYDEACFLTLTYEKSPVVLIKKDIQDFIKRLRKRIHPTKVKYFLCGEYGTKKMRPHFHIILFGYDFKDKILIGQSDKGYNTYKSPLLEKIWGKGYCTTQEVTYNSIAYCSLYASPHKRSLPKHLQKHPEFNLMSQGLGVEQILKKFDDYIKTDTIYIEGRRHNIPNIVLQKSGLSNLQILKLKKARQRKSKYAGLIAQQKFKKHKDDKMLYDDVVAIQKKIIFENKQKRLQKQL